MSQPQKSPGLAAVISFIFPGAGFIYCGLFGQFFLWFGIQLALLMAMTVAPLFMRGMSGQGAFGVVGFFLVALIALRIFELTHVYKSAEAFNRSLTASSRRGRGRRGSKNEDRSRRRRTSQSDLDTLRAEVRELEELERLKKRKAELSGQTEPGFDDSSLSGSDSELRQKAPKRRVLGKRNPNRKKRGR